MSGALADEIRALAPDLRGKLAADAPLAPFTWFRVGGPAEVLVSPADEDDLAYLLARLPTTIRVTVIGVGSPAIVWSAARRRSTRRRRAPRRRRGSPASPFCAACRGRSAAP